MRCHFFSMVKQENQSMQAWIASIRHAAFELEAANFQIQDIDLIIALTQGLPESYLSLIVSLNGTPLDQLNIDTLIICLLNEEACQLGPTTHTITPIPKVEFSDNVVSYVSSRATQKRPSFYDTSVHYFNCCGYGHLAKSCPSPKVSDAEAAHMAWMIDNIGTDGINDDINW
jgi:gag-polypeptide of LTR copia-type